MVRKFLLLNGISILGVILFHGAGWGFVAMFSWTHRYLPVASPNFDQVGSLTYYVLRTIEQLVVFVIPAFLFVSGFFVAFATGRDQKTIGWKTVKARIKKILVPYALWTLLLTGLVYLEGGTISLIDFLEGLFFGSINPAYYYVPLLIQFFLLSPLIIYLAKKNWKVLIITTGAIQLIVQLFSYPAILGMEDPMLRSISELIPKWFFLSRLFWFTSGVVVSYHLKTFKIWLVRYKWYFLVVGILLVPIGIIEWELYLRLTDQMWLPHRETLLDSIYTLAVVFSFLAFDEVSEMPFARQINNLGSKSFGIYLIHSPVMEYAARGIYVLSPWLLSHQGIILLIMIVLGLGIPLLMMYVVKKSPIRGFYQYIFG